MALPNSNWGFHRYYVNRFNKTGSHEAEYLALLYHFYWLAFGDGPPIPA